MSKRRRKDKPSPPGIPPGRKPLPPSRPTAAAPGLTNVSPTAPPQTSSYAAVRAASAGPLAWLAPLLVAALTFAAFIPALSADFVTWDDDRNFLTNPHYRGLSAQHLRWMFTTTKMGHYQPLSWLTLGLDYKLHGMNARGYHVTSLLLHCAVAVALYVLALRLLALSMPAAARAAPRATRLCAALAALLYAVHPLRVESVAWVTERRDVLSGLFFLLTLLAYVRATTSPHAPRLHRAWYLSALALMILSCLSKAWAMTLPAVLIILDAYPLRRLGRFPHDWFSRPALRVWLDKIPFLILAALTALQAARAQAGQFDTMKTYAEHGLLPRLGQAFYGLGFYLHKTLLPIALGPIYEVPYKFSGLETANILSAAVVITITAILLIYRRRFPAGLAAWAFYVVVVSPVLGIAQSGPQLVKDSYSYLCCLPWSLLAAAAILYLWSPARRVGKAQPNPPPADATGRLGAMRPDVHRDLPVSKGGSTVPGHSPAGPLAAPLSILAACLVLALAATTFRQTRFWQDSISLWSRAVAVQPRSQNANNNLAILLRKKGRIEDAVACYRRAIDSHPDEANAYYNLGNALKELARAAEKSGHPAAARDYYQQAVAQYRLAIDREPLQASYHFNLANTLTNDLDRGSEALPIFLQALRTLDLPKIPATQVQRSTLHYCIAFELHELGRLDEAREHLDAALRLDPDLAPAKRLRDRLDPTTP